MTLRLESLQPQAGSRRRKTRKGRGIAAGQGASCGFGMRGQKSRSGRPTRPGFEGGQMPLQRRLPKRGFKSHQLQFNAEVTLTSLEVLGLAEVDVLALKTAGLVGQMAKTIKVVKTGVLTKAVKLNGIGATAGAKAAIEAAGGSVA